MTKIEWTHRPGTKGESWNLIGGCTKVSPACDNCYALDMSWRIQNMEKRPDRYEDVCAKAVAPDVAGMEWVVRPSETLHWTGHVNLDYDALEAPYRWKAPRTVFVGSMADWLHPRVPTGFVVEMLAVMAACERHTFLCLTKRHERLPAIAELEGHVRDRWQKVPSVMSDWQWPLPNVWQGTTIENQEQADLRIPYLLQTPAAVRWVSVEPMLGAISIPPGYLKDGYYLKHGLDWVVIGGESGPNARRMEGQWAKDLIAQCDDAQVPVFVKQLSQHGFHYKLGRKIIKDLSQWQPELRRREWPK